MITFVSGMPGDGKSYFIMTEIERELVSGNRVIVTNVELNLGNVADYLHERYGKTFDLHSRYYLLTTQETKEFWLQRGTHQLSKGADGRCDFMTLDREQAGVCYVIDELHEHFNARAWAKTGADALTYSSQHRKLGDSVFFISQRAKQVDSQLRSLAGAYVYMRNLANRTLKLGPFVFRFGRTLIARAYPDEWTKGGAEPVVMWTKTLKVDPKGFGSWYDTAAGVGVRGKLADTAQGPVRGLPWPVMGLGLLIVLSLVWLIPKAIGAGMRGTFGALHDKGEEVVTNAPAVKPSPLPVMLPATSRVEKLETPALQVGTNIVSLDYLDLSRPRSVSVAPDGFVIVVLTNGVQLTSADGIELIGRKGFRYRGRLYPMP